MAKPKHVTYFKARLDDKPGALLAFAQNLKAKNISLSALWGYGTEPGEAVMFCIPKDPERFRSFARTAGMPVEEGNGFLVKGADKTGALLKPLDAIAKAGVNINALHAISAGGNYGAFIRVAPADIETTGKALGAV